VPAQVFAKDSLDAGHQRAHRVRGTEGQLQRFRAQLPRQLLAVRPRPPRPPASRRPGRAPGRRRGTGPTSASPSRTGWSACSSSEQLPPPRGHRTSTCAERSRPARHADTPSDGGSRTGRQTSTASRTTRSYSGCCQAGSRPRPWGLARAGPDGRQRRNCATCPPRSSTQVPLALADRRRPPVVARTPAVGGAP